MHYIKKRNLLAQDRFILISKDKNVKRMFSIMCKNNHISPTFIEPPSAKNIKTLVKEILSYEPHMVFLNILPFNKCCEIVSAIKKERLVSYLPIIILSGNKYSPDETIAALKHGAEDCIHKPINMKLLLARIQAILRRTLTERNPSNIMSYKELSMNIDSHTVKVGNRTVHLAPKEFTMLYFLLKNKGKVLSRKFLLRNIWGTSWTKDQRMLNKTVENLRKKIRKGKYIITVEGVGYKLGE